ncbi:NADPH-dependent F420 reductase [Catenuloplanes japonicus]|uniref:NADPH-dependent F420 reductase n=1 Tax=Catenuloplanes japonicus TaxID=33876 RepID=UPI000524D56D|nr:NAD(P)-binding domain-containing protein [Catenuloplanes japonicus]
MAGTTIGILGSGMIGGAIARLAVDAGYDVVVSNRRGPETLSELVADLGPHARAATPAEAAQAGDIVVIAIPLGAYRTLPVEAMRGKVVIDSTNYYPGPGNQIAGLDDESTTTGEFVQAHLPESSVIKALSNVLFLHLVKLARPAGDPERSGLPIAGDDEQAKATVARFVDAIGYDVVDAGTLAEGWRFQRDTPLYARPYLGEGGEMPSYDREFNPGPGAQVDTATVRRLLGEAKRYRDM